MRFLLFCLIVNVLIPAAEAQQSELNYSSAVQMAKDEHKALMLVFSGSDWCKPCMRLREEVLSAPDFASFAKDHLILLELDFPYRKKNQLSKERAAHNAELADRYNTEGVFPRIVLLDGEERLLGQVQNTKNLDTNAFIRLVSTILES